MAKVTIDQIRNEIHTSFLQHAFHYLAELKLYVSDTEAIALVLYELDVLKKDIAKEETSIHKNDESIHAFLNSCIQAIEEEESGLNGTTHSELERLAELDHISSSFRTVIDYIGGKKNGTK